MVLAAEVLLGAFILVLVGSLATGRSGGLENDAPDAPPFVLPTGPLRAADLSSIRLPLAIRGYRMAEVDALLDRIASQLEAARQWAAAGPADPAQAERVTDSDGLGAGPPVPPAPAPPPGVARQLLGVCMAATAVTSLVWALAAARHLPTLLAVLVSLAALLLLPVLWPVYGGASGQAGVDRTVDVPPTTNGEGSGRG
jgi:DivIVA domain-containing protein